MKFIIAILLVLHLAFVAAMTKSTRKPTKSAPTPPTASPTPAPTAPTAAPTYAPADAIGSGSLFVGYFVVQVNFSAAFTFLPDGRLLLVETYGGMVAIFDENTHELEKVWQVPGLPGDPKAPDADWDQACLGIAVHPDYPTTPYFYLECTRNAVNQILKLTVGADETVTDNTAIWSSPAGFNDGGPLKFGPDGKLYYSNGDGNVKANAQNLTASNNMGKYLRMNDDGSVPSDNPWPNSVNYFYGVRNSFGFDWDTTGDLWFTDNGPSCNDEVNLAKAGGNYGWGPKSHCPDTNASGKKIIKPKYDYKKARGTVGGEFDSEGRFLVGSFDLGTIDALTLNKKRDGIQSAVLGAYVIPPEVGNLLQIETSPVTMNTYFSTIGGIFRLGPKPTA